jgi:tRNA isopentenyl-2-thiomethyl-A-37 hydroxylase MiaE
MTPLFKTLMTVCLGALLLTSTGCEDKAAQEALKTCTDLINEQKLVASESLTISELKAQLAQAQAKMEETSKESGAKSGKAMEEKAKAGEEKKAEPVKGEKKDKEAKQDKKAKKEAKK